MPTQRGGIINHLTVILASYHHHMDFRGISEKYLLGYRTVRYLILLFMTLITSEVLAQIPASISGTIKDEQGKAIPGITVVLHGIQKGAITNGQGKFTITDIPPGNYTIEISGVSYEKQSFSLSFRKGDQIKRSILLKESTSELNEIVVTAESEARELELSAKSVQVIETRELKLKSADLGEVIAKTEGVNVQRAGGLGSNIRFSLNGLSGDQIRFFYNDIPLQFTPYAFGIANVPVNMIDRVEIYKGVVPIQFGADALGGAVNLASPEIYDGLAGAVSYQVGSFNTHRLTGNINFADEKTGLFAVAGGFYDYTDNNYKIDVAISNEQGQLQQRTVRRFHDGYRAYGANLRLGVRNKKWTNELSLEGYYGDYQNEVQNSQAPGLIDLPNLGIEKAVAGSPFGEVVFTSFSTGLNLNYNVNLNNKWKLDLKVGYNYNERVSIDTARSLYNWLGEVIRMQNRPGEFGEANHLITISENLFARQQLNYAISSKHVLKLSVAPTYAYRTGDDLLTGDEFDQALDDEFLFDLVTGLEYTTNLLKKQLQVIAFVKNYRQNIRIESFDQSVEETLIDKRSVSNYGAGNGLKYIWSPRFSTKLSYEFAYRLPRQDEIFGDGQLIFENPELQPESSHNLNLQWIYTNKENVSTDWQLRGNFFLRRIDDLILLLVGADDFGSFQNVWSATSRGFELSVRWKGFIEGLTILSNATYQQYLNTSQTGPFKSFEGDHIPNTPYFFVNGAAEFEWTDVFKRQDKLSVFWNVRYVNSFFVGWESAGLQQFKAEVPNQTIHAVGITHRMNIRNVQNALTLEVQNLTNAKVFDLFGVQRPGKAFYIKSTIQF
ncbi:MAG: carboxypeptidase-like regulatory domain-containing protein [Bacteroidota bacterium]